MARKKKRRIRRDSKGRFKSKLVKRTKIRRSKTKRTKKALAADRKRKALGPGKRRSRSGKFYWETRVNRAD